ncbi:MAG: phosphatidate cytidylyltransferase [Muribaculaceae bacterium]|nr:phosphatidate cytidylyltransferase [Muribaculaceae bacterium]
MKNLILRSTTGILYVAFIVFGIMYALWPLIFLLALGAMVEFQRLTARLGSSDSSVLRVYDTLAVMALGLLPVLHDWSKYVPLVWFVMIFIMIRPVISLYNSDMKSSLVGLAFSMLALVYIGVPLCLMGLVGQMPGGMWILLGMFIFIWLNDTGAFVIGSMIGSKKLFERLSPKKSWEGFFGGLVFSVLGAIVYFYCVKSCLPYNVSVVKMGIYGAIVSIFATWGDLFESMLKRAAGVKDSGNILPGHGGVLDRIDSFLFVSPVTFLYMIFIF